LKIFSADFLRCIACWLLPCGWRFIYTALLTVFIIPHSVELVKGRWRWTASRRAIANKRYSARNQPKKFFKEIWKTSWQDHKLVVQ
jgi:hypothetical protein